MSAPVEQCPAKLAPLPLCRVCMSTCDEGDTLCGGFFCWSKDEPEVRS